MKAEKVSCPPLSSVVLGHPMSIGSPHSPNLSSKSLGVVVHAWALQILVKEPGFQKKAAHWCRGKP